MLRFKHPDKFNDRGDGKWRGSLYGTSLQGLRLTRAVIHRGVFCTGLFQCIYQPGPAHWAMFPSTLEWHLAVALVGAMALVWSPAWIIAGAMLALSLLIAALQAARARLVPGHDGLRSRLLVAALCCAQPLVRSLYRYWIRMSTIRIPAEDPASRDDDGERLPLRGFHSIAYWGETGIDRTELLGLIIAYLEEHKWGKVVDSGWSAWDLEIPCHRWNVVRVCTVQEDHGGGKRLIQIRFRLLPTGYTRALVVASALALITAVAVPGWPTAAGVAVPVAACVGVWWRGVFRSSRIIAIFNKLAGDLGLIRCRPSSWHEEEIATPRSTRVAADATSEGDEASIPALLDQGPADTSGRPGGRNERREVISSSGGDL